MVHNGTHRALHRRLDVLAARLPRQSMREWAAEVEAATRHIQDVFDQHVREAYPDGNIPEVDEATRTRNIAALKRELRHYVYGGPQMRAGERP